MRASDRPQNGRRVVITGMGAISPLGLTVDKYWQGLVEGRSGLDFIRRVDSTNYPVKVDGKWLIGEDAFLE